MAGRGTGGFWEISEGESVLGRSLAILMRRLQLVW